MFTTPHRYALSALCVLIAGTASWAAPLGLTPQAPDITSGFIDVTYDATTDAFVATGFASAYDLDNIAPPDHTIVGGTFDITATIDAAGNASGGTLTIGGTIAALGANSGTLLTGTLLDFGFAEVTGGVLEFIFDVTGGDLASLDFPIQAGVVLDAGSMTFPGTFAADFNNLFMDSPGTGTGVSDTYAVPEPATMAMLALGGLAVVARRRRRKA